ncbi:GNAT family N-acetyltransferase [Rhodococcoides fascians]|uniref:GNAT family N-acetyltransferase n=1 Tax=Rhodococcoides fascians TaxID=1828 RepID=UPI00050CCA6F|nr:GNAT family N-acetyltransferase [Rhodococcus fascians]
MIRRATEADVPAITGLVHELAAYEKSSSLCTVRDEHLRRALFGAQPSVFAHVAEQEGVVVGCALWFLNFSTWDGVNGIYLEDLYVQPAARGGGFGRGLLAALAAECVANDYTRLTWSVLDWNTPSIGFYRSLGAQPQDEWTTFRLTEDALAELAATAR